MPGVAAGLTIAPLPPTAPVPAGPRRRPEDPASLQRPARRPAAAGPTCLADRRRPTVADVPGRARGPRPGPAVAARAARRCRRGPAVPRRSSPRSTTTPVARRRRPTVGAHVVLTRRTWALRTHRGEVSFPGGRVDDGESPVDAARREAEEEIALDPVARSRSSASSTTSPPCRAGPSIVPFVGALPGRPDTTPNPAEVDAVLHVPLAELLDPAIFREEIWTFPGGYDQPITFFELVGDTVWGATAVAAAPAARHRHRHPRPGRPRPPLAPRRPHQVP